MKKKALCIFILLLSSLQIGFCYHFNVTYLSAEEGLTQNEVTGIIQDRNGFMWFSTRGGLNRYDGYEFIHHKSKAKHENYLSNPSIETLFQDSNAYLWIGTKSGGLNRYDPNTETFKHINYFGKARQEIKDDRIVSIAETSEGKILVGTWIDGLYELDLKNDTLRHFLDGAQVNDILVDDECAWLSINGAFVRLMLDDYSLDTVDLGAELNFTKCIKDSNSDQLWLSAWSGGLISINKRTFQYKQFLIDSNKETINSAKNNTYSLLLDSQGRIWVGTWNGGLYLFDSQCQAFTKVDIKPIYMGSKNTDFDVILDIYEDHDSSIWVGTDSGGLVRLGKKQPFGKVSLPGNVDCGLVNFHISAFWKSPQGVLFVGTRGGGMFKTLDNKSFIPVPFSSANGLSYTIRHIIPINDSSVWVGTGDRIYELDVYKERSILNPVNQDIVRHIKKLTSYLELDNGSLIGTQQNGLYYIPARYSSLKKHVNFRVANNKVLENERITFIKTDLSKQIWIGTYKGIYFFDEINQHIISVKYSEGQHLTSDIVNCWYQSSDSVYWLGTPSGLNRLTSNKNGSYTIKQFYIEDGLPDDFIHGIISVNDTEIWVSTNAGLAKVNIEDNRIFSFDNTDGLQSMIFSEDQGYVSSDSTLYFGGIRGYNFFKSDDVILNKVIPPVVFTRFKVFGKEVFPSSKINKRVIYDKPLNTNPKITLSHKENEFTIEYAVLNYNAPERNKYAYKLIGYDKDWVQASTRRSVTYLNIPAGKYEFRVRGSNNNNVWNMQGAALQIEIEPALWETWYAFVFYALFILGIIILIRWSSIKKNNFLNNIKIEKMRHNQALQMNEMKLRFFTNISHEFRTPLTLILAPLKEILSKKDHYCFDSEVHNKLRIVQNNSLRLNKLVNQLLEFRKIESGNMKLHTSLTNIKEFVEEVCYPFFELAKINNVKFKMNLDASGSELWIDRDKVEVILNNLVSNSFKHVSEGGSISIKLSYKKDNIVISVIDNGSGIESSELNRIFERFYTIKGEDSANSSGIGLALVERYVKLHKGTISVTSDPNIKTAFTVTFQKGRQHLSPTQMTEIKQEKRDVCQPIIVDATPTIKTKIPLDFEHSILVVEDNKELNNYLVDLLQSCYTVKSAFDGKQGFDMAIEEMPHIIISDVMMPNVDGFEFCKNIRENVSTATIPFVFLTAKSEEQFQLLGTQLGADDFISKPFDPNLLFQKVKNILEGRQKLKNQYSKIVRLEPSDIEISSKEEEFLEKTIAVIEANLLEPDFSSQTLAESLNMSKTTFYRRLKKLTDMSIAAFIRAIRLKRAAQLLADEQYTISEISFMVGFNDVKNFRFMFQKQFSCNPSQYRKRLKAD